MPDTAANITSNVELYQGKLQTKVDAVTAQLELQSTYNTTSLLYSQYATDGQGVITSLKSEVDSIKNYWDGVINLSDNKYQFNNQGEIGTSFFNTVDKPTFREGVYDSPILSSASKNIQAFQTMPIDSYRVPLWDNYSTDSSQLTVDDTSAVSEDVYTNYVLQNKEIIEQEIRDAIDETDGSIGGRGFMFPNSSSAYEEQKILAKLLKELNDRARSIWEELAKKLQTYVSQMLSTAMERVDFKLSFNKQFAEIENKIAEVHASLQGILNDITIKQYTLNERQAIQHVKNAFLVLHSLYKSYLTSESAIFEAKQKEVMAKWDAESSRVVNELKALAVNTAIQGQEVKFATNQANTHLQAIYDGLMKDISSYESSFQKNSQGLAIAFEEIIQTVKVASESVISVVMKKGV